MIINTIVFPYDNKIINNKNIIHNDENDNKFDEEPSFNEEDIIEDLGGEENG